MTCALIPESIDCLVSACLFSAAIGLMKSGLFLLHHTTKFAATYYFLIELLLITTQVFGMAFIFQVKTRSQ